LFDLVDPAALHGTPVAIAATGGGEKHALVVEHQLRPLFGAFQAATLGTGIYVAESDFDGEGIRNPAVNARIEMLAAEAAFALCAMAQAAAGPADAIAA
jgi:FMN reductase